MSDRRTPSPFHRGDRVRLTAEGLALFTHPPVPATGHIVGFGRDGLTVRVRHDGARTAATYFAHLIEPVGIGARQGGPS